MTVVVTMAGAGKRFLSEGYFTPKYRISARGKTLFEWSMESLRHFFDQQFIFACLADHDPSWIEGRAAALGIKNFTVAPRKSLSLGQAQTAYDAIQYGSQNFDNFWIYNIDTYIEKGIYPTDIDGKHGCVHVFKSSNPAMSFVRYDDDGQVVELAEKKVISEWATVGAYGFKSIELYRQLYQASYLDGGVLETGGERYIAPMYQLLLNSGKTVCAPKLDSSAVHILGTRRS